MGCMCAKEGGLTSAVQLDIHASADTVWEVVTDIERLSTIVSYVESIQITSERYKSFGVGLRWTEERRVGNKVERQTITVVHMEEYSYTKHVSWPKPDGTGTQDIANTSTMTVQPVSDSECILICSFAIQLARLPWMHRFFKKYILTYAQNYVLGELQDYAKEAVKRQEQQDIRA